MEAATAGLSIEFATLIGEGSQCTKGMCALSPDGAFIASVLKTHVRVSDCVALTQVASFSCPADVDILLWSPNSKFVLVGSTASHAVSVHSIDDSKWAATWREGAAGLVKLLWAQNSEWVLAVSDFGIMTTAYNVVHGRSVIIEAPKVHPTGLPHNAAPSTLAFSGDGNVCAILTQKDCRDYVSVYACADFSQIRRFPIDTIDALSIHFSPDNAVIAVADDPLHYKLVLYHIDGTNVLSYVAYESALGVSAVGWNSPKSSVIAEEDAPQLLLLAVGSFDSVVRIVDGFTASVIGELLPPAALDTTSTLVYWEVDDGVSASMTTDDSAALRETSNTAVSARPVKPRAAVKPSLRAHTKLNTSTATATTKASEAVDTPSHFELSSSKRVTLVTTPAPSGLKGPVLPVAFVHSVLWSADSALLAVRLNQHPTSIFIHDPYKRSLVAVIHCLKPISDMAWSRESQQLCFVCGSPKVFMWNSDGASVVSIPGTQIVRNCVWTANDAAVLLTSHKSFQIGFIH